MLALFLFLIVRKDILDFHVRNNSLVRNLKSLDCKVTVTKSAWYWNEDRLVYHWCRTDSPATDPPYISQLISKVIDF